MNAGAMRAVVLALAVFSAAGNAQAAGRRRTLFEPTDIEVEAPGTIEVDTQIGLVRTDAPDRLVVPDFEIDVGLTGDVELDVDGTYALEGGRVAFLQPRPDNLWVSAKLALYSAGSRHRFVAFAAQLGPKLPIMPGARGVGYEALWLTGVRIFGAHVVLNTGAVVDPGEGVSRGRPAAFEGGFDLEALLSTNERLRATGELGGRYYVSSDPHELVATIGVAYAAAQWLDVSLIALRGFAGPQRAGCLLGVSPKIALW